jgi:hypothetical protein
MFYLAWFSSRFLENSRSDPAARNQGIGIAEVYRSWPQCPQVFFDVFVQMEQRQTPSHLDDRRTL